jgi:hypothetical protein
VVAIGRGGEHKGRLPYPIRNLQSAYLVCKYTNHVCVICCVQTWLGCKLCVQTVRCWVDVPPHRTTIEALGACCHGPIAHTPGCVLHMLYYVYYVVLNITWTYSSANDLTYHAVVLFPKRTWYSCCTNCTIDCGMSYVFTNTSCCIVLLLQWLPLMSLPLHHRLQHYRRTSASKVRCWVAVHVPEVCV